MFCSIFTLLFQDDLSVVVAFFVSIFSFDVTGLCRKIFWHVTIEKCTGVNYHIIMVESLLYALGRGFLLYACLLPVTQSQVLRGHLNGKYIVLVINNACVFPHQVKMESQVCSKLYCRITNRHLTLILNINSLNVRIYHPDLLHAKICLSCIFC